MFSVFLFTPNGADIEWFGRKLDSLGRLYRQPDESLRIERDGSWISIEADEFLLEELNEEESLRVVSLLPEHCGFLLRFSDVKFVSAALARLRGEQVVIDNEHGMIASIDSFMADPSWKVKWYTMTS